MAFPNPFNKQTQQQQPQANFSLIESELEKKVDYFNKIMYACKQKCISNEYNTSELTQGEALCIDRCLSKYSEADKKIEEKMKEQMGMNDEKPQEQPAQQ